MIQYPPSLRRRREYIDFTSRMRQRAQPPPCASSPVLATSPSPRGPHHVSETIFRLIRDYNCARWGDTLSTTDQLDALRDEHRKYDEMNPYAHGVFGVLKQGKLTPALVMMRRAPQVSPDRTHRTTCLRGEEEFLVLCQGISSHCKGLYEY